MARTRPPSLMTADRARTVLPVPHVGAPLDSAVWAELLGLSAPSSVSVTGDNVRGLPALDKAKAMVVNSVATMLVNATVSDQTGSPMPVPTVIRRPHPLLGRFEYFAQIVDSLVMHGSFVAIKAGEYRDDMTLLPAPLGAVSVDASSGLPEYTIENRTYGWWEVFHARAWAPVGSWWGIGVVEKFRRAMSEQLYGQAFGENSFKTGAVPSMSVQIDVDIPTRDQVQAAKSGIMASFGNGLREPMVHGKAMTLTPLSWSPHDAEFVESRKLSAAEAALMVGLRPEDIGATLGGSLTYGNRSDDALQRITDGYAPWMQLIEGPLSDLLEPGSNVAGNPEALLRTSTRERLELRQLAQSIGVETPDESRVAEGRTAITATMPEEAAP